MSFIDKAKKEHERFKALALEKDGHAMQVGQEVIGAQYRMKEIEKEVHAQYNVPEHDFNFRYGRGPNDGYI